MNKTIPSTMVWIPENSQSDSRFANQKRSFGSSFRPIFTLLKCLGVDVSWNKQRFKRKDLVRFAVWSFINTAVIIIYTKRRIEETTQQLRGTLEYKAVHEKIIELMIIAQVWIHILGIYFACVLATYQHGHRLAEAFERLEIHFPSGQRLHDRIHRISFLAVAIILMMVN